jgi:hypothetical protein
MLMGSNHAVAGNSQTELTVPDELENRIENLDKLVFSVDAALQQVSFSGKLRALDLMNGLRVKINSTHNMLRVAKLLSEPARESMLLRVRDSLDDLEEVIACNLDVEMT